MKRKGLYIVFQGVLKSVDTDSSLSFIRSLSYDSNQHQHGEGPCWRVLPKNDDRKIAK